MTGSPLAPATPDARRRDIARLAEQVRLPFRSLAWRGSSGGWQGMNQGNSIDFHAHRAYVPGDDPRHLDWAAYARTDHYTMKLFRQEVTPRLDLVLDVSRSMALTPEKEARSLDLLALVLGIALRDSLNPRVYVIHSAGQWRRLEPEAAARLQSLPAFALEIATIPALPLKEIPWQPGSLRVFISDLLVPASPESELAALRRDNGRVIVLAPGLEAEAEPDWQGNLDLRDCETRQVRRQRVEPFLLSRYSEGYRRHFELWQEEARRRGVPLARISCELSLSEAMRRQAVPAETFEVRH